MFILLAAYLPKEKVLAIFNKNLFEDASLLPLLQELLGVKNVKPFECVGTPQEVQLALLYMHQKKEWSDTVLMRFFEKEIMSSLSSQKILEENVLNLSSKGNIPDEFAKIV